LHHDQELLKAWPLRDQHGDDASRRRGHSHVDLLLQDRPAKPPRKTKSISRLGGDAQYTNEWTTTWTTHTDKETDSVDVSKVCYLNDGKFHKYTFDWYTDYGPIAA
jgi:hypothetical protein